MTILFPDGCDPKDYYSLGRNGCMGTSGVSLLCALKSLYISPINSKGHVGQGNIHVPRDRQFLLALAAALTKAANGKDL